MKMHHPKDIASSKPLLKKSTFLLHHDLTFTKIAIAYNEAAIAYNCSLHASKQDMMLGCLGLNKSVVQLLMKLLPSCISLLQP